MYCGRCPVEPSPDLRAGSIGATLTAARTGPMLQRSHYVLTSLTRIAFSRLHTDAPCSNCTVLSTAAQNAQQWDSRNTQSRTIQRQFQKLGIRCPTEQVSPTSHSAGYTPSHTFHVGISPLIITSPPGYQRMSGCGTAVIAQAALSGCDCCCCCCPSSCFKAKVCGSARSFPSCARAKKDMCERQHVPT